MDQRAYDELPEFLTLRETRIRIKQRGFRTRTLVIATTLLYAFLRKARHVIKREMAKGVIGIYVSFGDVTSAPLPCSKHAR
jgi:hypothetical protein